MILHASCTNFPASTHFFPRFLHLRRSDALFRFARADLGISTGSEVGGGGDRLGRKSARRHEEGRRCARGPAWLAAAGSVYGDWRHARTNRQLRAPTRSPGRPCPICYGANVFRPNNLPKLADSGPFASLFGFGSSENRTSSSEGPIWVILGACSGWPCSIWYGANALRPNNLPKLADSGPFASLFGFGSSENRTSSSEGPIWVILGGCSVGRSTGRTA